MSIQFPTTYYLPPGTPYQDIRTAMVEVDDEHTAEAEQALAVGAPILENFVRRGLSEGWITIISIAEV